MRKGNQYDLNVGEFCGIEDCSSLRRLFNRFSEQETAQNSPIILDDSLVNSRNRSRLYVLEQVVEGFLSGSKVEDGDNKNVDNHRTWEKHSGKAFSRSLNCSSLSLDRRVVRSALTIRLYPFMT